MKCSCRQTAHVLITEDMKLVEGAPLSSNRRIRPRQLVMIPSASDLRTRVRPESLRSKPAIVQNFER